jgi:hypothetical protein
VPAVPIRKCNPLYGYRWFREGIVLFLKQPWPWLALVGMTFLLTLVLGTLPLLGLIAVFLLLPGVVGGFMLGAREVAGNRLLLLPHIIAGLRRIPRPLIAIGGINFLATLAGMFLLSLGWSDEFAKLLELLHSAAPDQQAVEQAMANLTVPSLVSLGLMIPVAMANWFAAALVVFRSADVKTAMVSSLHASLRNFWPFVVYTVLLVLLDVAVSLLLQLVLSAIGALGNETAVEAVALFLTFPIVCCFFSIILASMYVSYTDVYEANSGSSPS